MSLVYEDEFIKYSEYTDTVLLENQFYKLFYDNKYIKNAENLILPVKKLGNSCYESMFEECINLINAPKLQPTKNKELQNFALADECYLKMFKGCSSLIEAPDLLKLDLEKNCYSNMFQDCTSLIKAPKLPAEILKEYCYSHMFDGCTSLTTAPELPAITLEEGCYSHMFYGCSELNHIIMLATNIDASSCLSNWVSGVASTGTFVKHPNMTTLLEGENGIPSGWTPEDYVINNDIDYSTEYFTIVNTSDSPLDVQLTQNTTIQTLNYKLPNSDTWSEGTSITVNVGGEIQLKGNYTPVSRYGIGTFNISRGTFDVKGNIMSLLFNDDFEEEVDLSEEIAPFFSLFKNCTTLVNANELILPATTLGTKCYESMFEGCEGLTTAPALPATILAFYCYKSMFRNCVKLTTSPELPAAGLTFNCYQNMFEGCSELNHITMLASTLTSGSLDNWVNGIASNGTFIKHPSMRSLPRGNNGVPKNWNIQDNTETEEEIALFTNESSTTSSISFIPITALNTDMISKTYTVSQGVSEITEMPNLKISIYKQNFSINDTLIPTDEVYKNKENSYQLNGFITYFINSRDSSPQDIYLKDVEERILFSSKQGELKKPTHELNSQDWGEYTNQGLVYLKGGYCNDDYELNYINYNNEEASIKNYIQAKVNLDKFYNVYTKKISPVKIQLGFESIHYSKYYRETQLYTSELPVLEPFLNTVEDLRKNDLDVVNSLTSEGKNRKNLIFAEIMSLGVGYGNKYHNLAGIYQNKNNSFDIGTLIRQHYTSEKGSPHIGMTRYSSTASYTLQNRNIYNWGLPGTRDHVHLMKPVIFGADTFSDNVGDGFYVWSDQTGNSDYPNDEYYKLFRDPGTYTWHINGRLQTLPAIRDGLAHLNYGDIMNLCSFLVRDISDEHHVRAIDNVFPLFRCGRKNQDELDGDMNTWLFTTAEKPKNSLEFKTDRDRTDAWAALKNLYHSQIIRYKTIGSQRYIRLKEYIEFLNENHLPLTIGDAMMSPISNLYKYSDSTKSITSSQLSNIVFLEDQKTSFFKDVIYEFKYIKEQQNSLDNLIMLGVTVEDYRDYILDKMGIKNTSSGNEMINNLNIGINNIRSIFFGKICHKGHWIIYRRDIFIINLLIFFCHKNFFGRNNNRGIIRINYFKMSIGKAVVLHNAYFKKLFFGIGFGFGIGGSLSYFA